jgi:toxin ParE1/3/4
MAYRVVRSEESRQDLNLLFRHLVDSYMALGDPLADAFRKAARRLESINSDIKALGVIPNQGTLHDDIWPGLRHVTKNQAVFYFLVDDTIKIVRVVAVFFGGQDHQKHMLRRLWGS